MSRKPTRAATGSAPHMYLHSFSRISPGRLSERLACPGISAAGSRYPSRHSAWTIDRQRRHSERNDGGGDGSNTAPQNVTKTIN